MASDADYMAFLDKANQDVSGAGQATARGGQAQFKAVDAGTRAPEVIEAACKDTFYVSDADEPFVSVSLRWSGEDGLPDEGTVSDPFVARVVFAGVLTGCPTKSSLPNLSTTGTPRAQIYP